MLKLADLFENLLKLINLKLNVVTESVESAEGRLLRIVLDVVHLMVLLAACCVFHSSKLLQQVLNLALLRPELLLVPLEVLDEGFVAKRFGRGTK